MYQTPPTPSSSSDDISESAISEQLSEAAETIKSSLSFSLLDEMSDAALLACIFLVGILIFLVMWYYDSFRWWIDAKRQNGSLRWRRWRNRRKHLPVLEINHPSSIADEEEEYLEQGTQRSRRNGWFFNHHQEAPPLETNEWFLDKQDTQPQRPSDWFLDQPQYAPASETQTDIGVDPEVA